MATELESFAEDYLMSDVYKNNKSDLAEQEKIRVYFTEKRFPLDKVKTMSIDDYVEGKSDTYRDSFCYILEFRLQKLGQIRGSYVKSKFVIHYSETSGKYEFQPGSKFGKTAEEVFSNVRKEIVNLIEAAENDDYSSLESNRLSKMFKGKIYYVYYPDKTLPIYNEEHIDFFIRALDVKCDIDKIGIFEKKRIIIEWKNSSKVFSKMTNIDFASFLYSDYGFGKETNILKKKEVSYDDEPEIIDDIDLIDRAVKNSTHSNRKPNYEEINRKKTAIGLSGEEYVLNIERKHNKKYKNKIERVGDNPSYGYDILSYDLNGKEKHIEVKTSVYGDINKVDFYITAHEKEKLESDDCYKIYYVCGMRGKKRKIIVFTKENLSEVTFDPIAYKITATSKKESLA